jgi:hypothetical protein
MRLLNILSTKIKRLERVGSSPGILVNDITTFWQGIEHQATKHHIDFGYLYATSGWDISGIRWKGILDWGIISCPASQEGRNKVYSLN